MAAHPYPTFSLNGACVCGWRWRVQYKLACSDSEGVYQDGACTWEEVEDSKETVGTSLEDPVLTWKWDEQNEDGANCSGWLYGPKHMDCAVGKVEEDYLPEDLPDLDTAPGSGYCSSCCKCKRWKLDYKIECDPLVDGQSLTCHWKEVVGSEDEVDCPEGSEDHEGGYFDDSAGDGTAVLYGPPHGESESGEPDYDKTLATDPTDCSYFCKCVQWQRLYFFVCQDDWACSWATTNAEGNSSVPYLGPCSDYLNEFYYESGSDETAMLYGGQYLLSDAPESAEDDPLYDETLVPEIADQSCHDNCPCVQLVQHFKFECNENGTCGWVETTEDDGTSTPPKEESCHPGYSEAWGESLPGKLGEWYGKQHPSGVIPHNEAFNPQPPQFDAVACASLCNCMQWRLTFTLVVNDKDGTCRWVPAGGEDNPDYVWDKCSSYENTFKLFGSCLGIAFGHHHKDGLSHPHDTPDHPADGEADCVPCQHPYQYKQHYEIHCRGNGVCYWAKDTDAEWVEWEHEEGFVEDDPYCGGTVYGPKHYTMEKPLKDLEEPPDISDSVCLECHPIKQWIAHFSLVCNDTDGSCGYEIDGDWEWLDWVTDDDHRDDANPCDGLTLYRGKDYCDVQSEKPTDAPGTPGGDFCEGCCICHQHRKKWFIQCDELGDCIYVEEDLPSHCAHGMEWIECESEEERVFSGEFCEDSDAFRVGATSYGPYHYANHNDETLKSPNDADFFPTGICEDCCKAYQYKQHYILDCNPCAFVADGDPVWVVFEHEEGWHPETQKCYGGWMYGPKQYGGVARPPLPGDPPDPESGGSGSLCFSCCVTQPCKQWTQQWTFGCDPDCTPLRCIPTPKGSSQCTKVPCVSFGQTLPSGDGVIYCTESNGWCYAIDSQSYKVDYDIDGNLFVYLDHITVFGKRGTQYVPKSCDLTADSVQEYFNLLTPTKSNCDNVCPCKAWRRTYKLHCAEDGSCSWIVNPTNVDAMHRCPSDDTIETPAFVPNYQTKVGYLYGIRMEECEGDNDVPNDLDSNLTLVPTPSEADCADACGCQQRVTTWHYAPYGIGEACVWTKKTDQVLGCDPVLHDKAFLNEPSQCRGTIYGPYRSTTPPPEDAQDTDGFPTPEEGWTEYCEDCKNTVTYNAMFKTVYWSCADEDDDGNPVDPHWDWVVKSEETVDCANMPDIYHYWRQLDPVLHPCERSTYGECVASFDPPQPDPKFPKLDPTWPEDCYKDEVVEGPAQGWEFVEMETTIREGAGAACEMESHLTIKNPIIRNENVAEAARQMVDPGSFITVKKCNGPGLTGNHMWFDSGDVDGAGKILWEYLAYSLGAGYGSECGSFKVRFGFENYIVGSYINYDMYIDIYVRRI